MTENLDTVEFAFPLGDVSENFSLPFSSLVRMDFGAVSHPGKVRSNNEDSYLIYRTGRYWQRMMTSLPDQDLPERIEEMGYLMAVADGVGGSAAGEVASRTAIRLAVNLVVNAAQWALKLDAPETREHEIEAARLRAEDYFRKIDLALAEQAERYPALHGMATTLTAAYVHGKDLMVVHAGDSRAYLFRQGKLLQLTRDHTLAQALVDSGAIPPELLKASRFRHTLTSCLGGEERNLVIDFEQFHILDNDRILVCTDGLTDMVSEHKIAEVLMSQASCSEACGALMDLALQSGGIDNITVLLARYSVSGRS